MQASAVGALLTGKGFVGGDIRKAGTLLFRLIRALDSVESGDCRRCGLTKGQALALLALKPGSCVSMRDVARSLGVTAGTATRVVDNLVRDGLARRGAHPSDRRCVCGCPTPKGQDRIGLIEKCYEECWRRVFGKYSKARLARVIKTLKTLASSIEDAGNECCIKKRLKRRKTYECGE